MPDATQLASSVSWVFAMMIAPAALRFFVNVASYGGTRSANASAPPVVGMSVVWMLSLSATGMPCNGPRILPAARSRSSESAMASALGFTVTIALILSSYFAMRVRYWRTISRDVVRFCSSALRRSAMLASTTVKGAAGFWPLPRWAASGCALVTAANDRRTKSLMVFSTNG